MNLYIDKLEAKKEELIAQIRSHSFLQRCRAGEVRIDELKHFLVQQGLYSAYFTRYLCALMASLPSNREVMGLAENLFEELGLEDKASVPHHILYREMLDQFGLTLEHAVPEEGTALLIREMLDHCKRSNPAYGLGALCLGAEALVPGMYSDIIQGFLAQGVTPDEIAFFRIHVECDDGHAETIRDIMAALAEEDAAQIDIMLNAGQALVAARLRFFSDIESMARRAHKLAAAAPVCVA